MRYYSEDVVDGIIDDAIQYGIEIDAGGIGERPIASHYPSVSSNWHTGIPTEEGDYVLRLKFQNLRWDVVHYKDGKFMSYHDHRIDLEDIIKWQKIEETD